MPYELRKDETPGAGVRRILGEQIDRARTSLTDESAPVEKRVHDARKRFKETRALLRLVRGPLGAQFAIENAFYRDLGRELAAARDAEAVIEALEKLDVPRAVAARVRNTLRARQSAHPPLEPVIVRVLDLLGAAEVRLAQWPELGDTFDTLAAGLRRTYREGRRAMRTASSDDELHEWRKRVKEHWYHIQLLRDLWPSMMKPYAAVMQDLSRALGDHHDLHVLRSLVTAPTVVAAIALRQRTLEAEARAIGARVYAEPSRAWLARMRRLWIVWQA
jgi:CHAD domain-containing protein